VAEGLARAAPAAEGQALVTCVIPGMHVRAGGGTGRHGNHGVASPRIRFDPEIPSDPKVTTVALFVVPKYGGFLRWPTARRNSVASPTTAFVEYQENGQRRRRGGSRPWADTTDDLLDLVSRYAPDPPPREPTCCSRPGNVFQCGWWPWAPSNRWGARPVGHRFAGRDHHNRHPQGTRRSLDVTPNPGRSGPR